ncbi:YopX family protein [Brochothrix campestris]|uniref:YopX protein domain-containing protein n=1 Tax=Brochothrix campestris FSL F6-1037 TaxID=1265861 RepID=W7CB61_9LIST|nr:YopX family protein [Brochothrix campestris]EUJ34167.1 hypothetical protein BCAMP_12718 [Brochothrix campestris FSL F6-1037]
MGETKFRGYSKRLNKWVYGDLVDGNVIVNGIAELNSEYIAIENWEAVVTESVGQYTGLKDKNGVDIYEGDIVKFNDFDSLRTGGNSSDKARVAKVVFLDGAYCAEEDSQEFLLCNAVYTDSELEVIGNIYENKELLK